MILTEIADRYRTDKGSIESAGHLFTEFYEPYFEEKKKLSQVRILEIGVYKNASLKMYQSYFPNCEIIGFDIEDKSEYNDYNIRNYIVDQSNPIQIIDTLNKLGNPKFDIIVDDGSHRSYDQIVSLMTLFR